MAGYLKDQAFVTRPGMRGEWWWVAGVAALTLVAYLALLPRFVDRLAPLTGDEPYYVMTAISIMRDGDLDESNNYAARDYEEFYPETPLATDWNGWPSFPTTLPPHPAVTQLDGLHTKHALGLSLLVAVPYELLGRIGAMLVIVFCGTALSGQMYLLGREAGAGHMTSAIVAVGLAVSMPLGPYALLIFPEIPAALLLLYAIRRLASRENSLAQWVLAGAAVGFLPWLHQRFIPSAAILGLVLAWRLVRLGWRRVEVVALAPVALGAASLLAYNWWMYRSPMQNVEDHAGFSGFQGTLNGGYGLILDAQWGLLIAAPALLLAVAALPWWLVTNPRTVILAAAVVAPYLVVIASYRVWWGEWGPPARYLVPVVPLAAGPLCAWLRSASFAGKLVYGLLWVVGFALVILGAVDPQRFYHQPNGWNNLWGRLDRVIGADVAERLVSFQPFALAPDYDRATAALILTSATLIILVGMYLPLALRSITARREQYTP